MNVSTANRDPHTGPSRIRFPRPALRQRSAEHPMAMFAIVTGIAVMTMAFVPTAGPRLATPGASVRLNDDIKTAPKLAELPIKASDVACHGQTWGDEDERCLVTIGQESGKGDRVRVRRLASAAQLTNAPNVF